MTQELSKERILQDMVEKVPSLKLLDAFVGEWNMKMTDPSDPAAVVYGQADFSWLPGEYFMVQHWEIASVDFPAGISITGWSAITHNFSMHYYDSRGVARIYEMSLEANVWKVWRVMPGFSQRFKGTFSADGNTILGSWEKSVDDSVWEYDFDVTYTRVATETKVQVISVENQENLSLLGDYR
jgi:hypothetical protein